MEEIFDTGARLRWHRPDGADPESQLHYHVLVSLDEGLTFNVMATTDRHAYRMTDLRPNTRYTVTVVSRTSAAATEGPKPASRHRHLVRFSTLIPQPPTRPPNQVWKAAGVDGNVRALVVNGRECKSNPKE